jgi:hypothetical protein
MPTMPTVCCGAPGKTVMTVMTVETMATKDSTARRHYSPSATEQANGTTTLDQHAAPLEGYTTPREDRKPHYHAHRAG